MIKMSFLTIPIGLVSNLPVSIQIVTNLFKISFFMSSSKELLFGSEQNAPRQNSVVYRLPKKTGAFRRFLELADEIFRLVHWIDVIIEKDGGWKSRIGA